jgi:anti-sigma regulatory factor (Ser/Thr protein kinase)
MVTAAIGVISLESMTFTYATAGHPPILYADKNGGVRELTSLGIPLGIVPEYIYSENSLTLDESGLLVLYTDGLTEFNRNIEVGERELARVVRECAGMSKPNLAESIVRTVVTGKPLDDIAVLTVDLHEESFDVLDISVPALASSARVIRRSLRRLCLANGLSEDQMFRVLVATGEAVSNAIEHAYSSGSGLVRVQGSRKDGSLVIEVSDEGRWREGRRHEGGRGLELMRRLMDEVVIDQTGGGTAVRQRLRIGEQ